MMLTFFRCAECEKLRLYDAEYRNTVTKKCRQCSPGWFRNHYDCPTCDVSWSSEWDCTCNDGCECGAEIEPTESEDIELDV